MRGRTQAAHLHLLHRALASVLGSNSKSARAMTHPAYWRSIRHHAVAHHAPKAQRKPPQRWHHNYAQRLLDEHADQLLDAFRPLAHRLARELGCLDPAAPVLHTHPARGQYVVGDGTVVAAPVRKTSADRWAEQGRHHVHAGVEAQNGENDTEFRWGIKFAMLATHPDCIRNNRVILDVDTVPVGKGYGGEALVLLRQSRRVKVCQPVAVRRDAQSESACRLRQRRRSFCLGANLARREIRVVFEELHREIPDIAASEEPARLRSAFIHGIKTLPVAWTPPD
jgi:hypothetical protein